MATRSVRRYEPLQDIAVLRDEMERMFRQLFGTGVPKGEDATVTGAWSPSLDIEEMDERFVVHVELPGVTLEDIDISIEDDLLTIDGERRFYEEKEAEGFRRIERRFGSFHRALRLPTQVLAEKVEAHFADGLLTITVPKTEEVKPHKVTVTAT